MRKWFCVMCDEDYEAQKCWGIQQRWRTAGGTAGRCRGCKSSAEAVMVAPGRSLR
ncbi:TPA: hypothetical protein RVT89_004786 [Escherichia coli]|nr:hypothetical protein [Escherichia coli]ELR3427855.1 hypothetical protein [Escherichia coli]ELR3438666.1 hypothetical protein [Escherichia coli]ELW7895470.1 hypothetical protein [Escherichia coli]MCD8813798.1 zinc-ribbon domain-containing protein [Escherichia coli]